MKRRGEERRGEERRARHRGCVQSVRRPGWKDGADEREVCDYESRGRAKARKKTKERKKIHYRADQIIPAVLSRKYIGWGGEEGVDEKCNKMKWNKSGVVERRKEERRGDKSNKRIEENTLKEAEEDLREKRGCQNAIMCHTVKMRFL